jgi:D-methionine transport system ATP-binding protein
VIRLEKLSKAFRAGGQTIHALVDIELSVRPGQIFGVIGSSGAGKSTLIRCVNLLERPTSGKVFVDGRELTALPERDLADARRAIGMIFQQPNLLASRTIAGNVALPLELAGVRPAQIRERVDELLALVGISDKRDARPAQLSGGQRQRATIARALANHPKVLLCDEATSALDPATTRSILELLREINQRLALTILLITHEMDVVKSVCDELAIISDGRLIEQGTVEGMFARAKTELARAFIRSTVQLDLPEDYRARLSPVAIPNARPVLRVELAGDRATASLISRLSRAYRVDVAIIRSRTDSARGACYGAMLLELIGEEPDVTQALAFLREQSVDAEVVGYVTRDA